MQLRTRRRAIRGTRQMGLSLVELLVGIAVGLIVLAGATLLLSTQLGDNRRLLLETQLQQDLRATMDIMTRELRRAGANADASVSNVWQPGFSAATANALAGVEINESGSEVVFRYRRGGAQGPYGFRWADGRIRSLVGNNWQELTDANVMRVTAFSVSEILDVAEVMPCPRACTDGTTSCWPTMTVRTLTLSIEAQSVSDAAVRRSQTSQVRLRNDRLGFNNGVALCPT